MTRHARPSLPSPRNPSSLRLGKRLGLTLLQTAALCLLAWFTQQLASWMGLPFPGSVLGMMLLLLALKLKLCSEQALALGAAWLIGDLMLFFIPSVIGVLKYDSLFQQYGASLIASLITGSMVVIAATALVVDRLFRFEQRRNRQLSQHPQSR
ncbi:holin-like protein [Ferrimonas sediminum]|uniref:Holin-like protein n=1 Tax=Ferrimonas sediminum TaxID=718193 RepID=A0A1G8UFY9_9GAMM|nr:CidA/LrgA family protein [Ferrimonas sediminum]SDJ52669.1 holin-like protein [Ferrimonas sediminum]